MGQKYLFKKDSVQSWLVLGQNREEKKRLHPWMSKEHTDWMSEWHKGS